MSGSLAFSQIGAGQVFTCAVTTTDHAAYCWGYQNWGQLGNGVAAATAVTFPVAVSGSHLFSSVGVGDSFSLAVVYQAS